jgi:hypothetical protein
MQISNRERMKSTYSGSNAHILTLGVSKAGKKLARKWSELSSRRDSPPRRADYIKSFFPLISTALHHSAALTLYGRGE